MQNSNAKTFIIRDLEFFWAKLTKPEANRFGNEVYDLQVRFPKKRKREMEKLGFKVRVVDSDTGAMGTNISRKSKNAKGEATPVRVVNSLKQPLDKMIGNGSKGHVIVYQYPWNMGGRSGTKTILVAVQVTDFIEYKDDSVDFDVIGTSTQESDTVDF